MVLATSILKKLNSYIHPGKKEKRTYDEVETRRKIRLISSLVTHVWANRPMHIYVVFL